jgi:hypothetical protein
VTTVKVPETYVRDIDHFRRKFGIKRSYSVAKEGEELVIRVYDQHDQVAGEKRLPLVVDLRVPERE